MTDPESIYPFDLGPWRRKVTTGSPEAQRWFDRGLNWTYAYNQEEAVVCFRRALAADPDCAMAWWGVAYAAGPFYNRPWVRFTADEIAAALPVCHAAAQAAQAGLERATPAERALIAAIALRYQDPDTRDLAVLEGWHRAFAEAMQRVHRAHPEDLDIAALFAEAAVTCTPRRLWNLNTGAPNPDSLAEAALAALEPALARIEQTQTPHPGVLHMYIHALEMSPFPDRAMRAADMLRGYAPDAGHMDHMPAHIYVLCGDYAQSVEQSRRAVAADDKYRAYAGADNFYTTARCHDLHLYMYAAMHLGQYRAALYAADRICDEATPALISASSPFMASILDGYAAMRTHVLVRFGQWRALAAAPPPADAPTAPIRTAMRAYGKGVAHAALGEVAEARAAQRAFETALTRIPEEAVFLSNSVRRVMAVGEAMLAGELAYREGDMARAFEALRLAVARDDSLNYTEPWAWMHPPRHALGALLAEQGRFEEAEAVYRADLGLDDVVPRCCQHPDNVWALRGLVECVERRGDHDAARLLRQRLTFAAARTDVEITASCCCRGGPLSGASS